MATAILSRWWVGRTVGQYLFWSDRALIAAGRKRHYLQPKRRLS